MKKENIYITKNLHNTTFSYMTKTTIEPILKYTNKIHISNFTFSKLMHDVDDHAWIWCKDKKIMCINNIYNHNTFNKYLKEIDFISYNNLLTDDFLSYTYNFKIEINNIIDKYQFKNVNLSNYNEEIFIILDLLYTYYFSPGLLDDLHWGYIGFKKWVDNLIDDIKDKISNKIIYIISDSTIDYYGNYEKHVKDGWDNFICKNIVKQKEQYIIDKLKKINSKCFIDAIGGTGYFYYDDTYLNNLNNINNIFSDLHSDITINNYFIIINKLYKNKILFNISDNNFNDFISRIIINYYIYNIKYDCVLCIGGYNDITNILEQPNNYNKEMISFIINLFIKFTNFMINNHDLLQEYKINTNAYDNKVFNYNYDIIIRK
jgi:hypothetical protein